MVNVLMVGTGEYTTGFVGGQKADSDKGAGVVGLVMFDLRSRGKVNRLGMVGVNGTKFPSIRQHMKECIADVYSGLDTSCETFPADDEVNSDAYIEALDSFAKGDACVIFTPDDTHFEIAMAAIQRGLHVLVTKPPVKTLAEHLKLAQAAEEAGVLVMVEVHKRFDPIYVDAKDRMRKMGECGYFYSYMSQPKHQLETFKAWAGKSSDISYYLNSHHVDFHEWAMLGIAQPTVVVGSASTGVALSHNIQTEDTITLTATWENLSNNTTGTAVYTSSWSAPKSDVHSQQRFFYLGTTGEVSVDQAHRGYTASQDGDAFCSPNPLFMKYTPSNGKFSGQQGYGYRSFEAFIEAVAGINDGSVQLADLHSVLPTASSTVGATAILEAGRRSLDAGGQPMRIVYATGSHIPQGIEGVAFC